MSTNSNSNSNGNNNNSNSKKLFWGVLDGITCQGSWKCPGILGQFDFYLHILWKSRSSLEEVGCNTIFFFRSHVVHQILFCDYQDELG